MARRRQQPYERRRRQPDERRRRSSLKNCVFAAENPATCLRFMPVLCANPSPFCRFSAIFRNRQLNFFHFQLQLDSAPPRLRIHSPPSRAHTHGDVRGFDGDGSIHRGRSLCRGLRERAPHQRARAACNQGLSYLLPLNPGLILSLCLSVAAASSLSLLAVCDTESRGSEQVQGS